MPNRILRDCTDSVKINCLDGLAERFFYRLIMVVDDFGRYYAHPGLLRAKMFPFLLDKVSERDILRWRNECEGEDVVTVYKVDNKEYIPLHCLNGWNIILR